MRAADRSHASLHAAQAARYLLDDLKSRTLPVKSIDEAITRGYLTDLRWCEVLDSFREGAQTRPAAGYQRKHRAKPKAALP